MKKAFTLVLALILSLALLASCGNSSEPAQDETQDGGAAAQNVTLRVAASPTPHAEILNSVKEALAAEGVTLEVVEFTDYVQPNLATENGDVDANYFQHGPYLEWFNDIEITLYQESVQSIVYDSNGDSISAYNEDGTYNQKNAKKIWDLYDNGLIDISTDS